MQIREKNTGLFSQTRVLIYHTDLHMQDLSIKHTKLLLSAEGSWYFAPEITFTTHNAAWELSGWASHQVSVNPCYIRTVNIRKLSHLRFFLVCTLAILLDEIIVLIALLSGSTRGDIHECPPQRRSQQTNSMLTPGALTEHFLLGASSQLCSLV